MSRSVQKKFFEMLETQASANNLELVMQTEWANTGTLHLQHPGSFETALSLPYQFDKRTYFGWMGRREDKPAVFPDRPNPVWAGFEPHELGDAITAIITYAKAHA